MTMKRSILLLLAVLLVFTLAACGGNNENEANNTTGKNITPVNNAENEANEENEPPEEVTLKFYNWNNDGYLTGLTEKFKELHPHITVESITLVPGGDAPANLQKMDVLMAAGEQTDIIMLSSIDDVMTRAGNGILASLNDHYDAHGIDPEETFISNPKFNDDYVAAMVSASYWTVLLNKDHLDEVGLPVPEMGWTWDDFRDYAEALTKGEGNDKQFGAYLHNWGEYANPILYTERSHPYMVDENTPIFDDPSFEYWFNLRKSLEDDGYVKPYSDVVGAKLAYPTEFFTEKASMTFIGSWSIGQVGDVEKFPHDFVTAYAPMPRSGEDVEEGYTLIGGNYLAIPESSEYKEEAFEFIEFLTRENESIRGRRDVDNWAVVEEMVAGSEHLYDLESLKHTLFDPRVKQFPAAPFSVTYGLELKQNVLQNGWAQHSLDNTPIEEVEQWMMDEANKVIKNAQ